MARASGHWLGKLMDSPLQVPPEFSLSFSLPLSAWCFFTSPDADTHIHTQEEIERARDSHTPACMPASTEFDEVPLREGLQGSTAMTSAAGFNYGAFMAEVVQVLCLISTNSSTSLTKYDAGNRRDAAWHLEARTQGE